MRRATCHHHSRSANMRRATCQHPTVPTVIIATCATCQPTCLHVISHVSKSTSQNCHVSQSYGPDNRHRHVSPRQCHISATSSMTQAMTSWIVTHQQWHHQWRHHNYWVLAALPRVAWTVSRLATCRLLNEPRRQSSVATLRVERRDAGPNPAYK